jgi:hypothetical protein
MYPPASLYGSTALWTLADFQFLNPKLLGSARHKAATYIQNNTITE